MINFFLRKQNVCYAGLQVLLETLRMYSPAPLTPKLAMKGGFKLPVEDYFIPGRTMMFVSCPVIIL